MKKDVVYPMIICSQCSYFTGYYDGKNFKSIMKRYREHLKYDCGE